MKGKTDWQRVDALTDEDIRDAVAGDPDTRLLTAKDFEKGHPMFIFSGDMTGYGKPVVTVNKNSKWYSIYVIHLDGRIEEVPIGALDDKFDYKFGSAFADHVPNPLAVRAFAERNDYVVDELSYEVIVGRWEIEVQEHYNDDLSSMLPKMPNCKDSTDGELCANCDEGMEECMHEGQICRDVDSDDSQQTLVDACKRQSERIAQFESAIAWLLSPEGAAKHAWWRSTFEEKIGTNFSSKKGENNGL